MIRVAFCNLKGGTGKTTLTVLIGRALAEAGVKVAVHDLDPQETATEWIRQRMSDELRLYEGGMDGLQVLLVDSPPTLEGVRSAVRHADAFCVVAEASPVDLWASKRAVAVLREDNKKSKCWMLFNKVLKNTKLCDSRHELAKAAEISALKSFLTQRQCYKHAAAFGWGALDNSAKNELGRVGMELMSTIAGN